MRGLITTLSWLGAVSGLLAVAACGNHDSVGSILGFGGKKPPFRSGAEVNTKESDAESIGDSTDFVVAQDLFTAKISRFTKKDGTSFKELPKLKDNPRFTVAKHGGDYAFQSDLHDIGKTIDIDATVVFPSGAQENANVRVKVQEPKVSTHACSETIHPTIGDVKPELKWHWKGTTVDGVTYGTTFSAPVVGNLDGQGVSEVVVIASRKDVYHAVNGPLVVLDGETGVVLWDTVKDGGFGAEVSTTPAVADLNGDGKMEIIAVQMVNASRALVIMDYTGRRIASTFAEGFECGKNCMVAVGDLDGNGTLEISAGNVILNSDGSLRGRLSPVPTMLDIHNTTTIADLDPASPGNELIVNGSQVYDKQGRLLWKGDCLGYSAVADIYRAGESQLICVGQQRLKVYSSPNPRE